MPDLVCLLMAALALHACATAPSADQSSSCGPAERAAKTVHTVTGVIGKYYDRFRLGKGAPEFVERVVYLDTRRLDKGSHYPVGDWPV